MTPSKTRQLEQKAAILKSLAHPSRLLIIEMLESAPCCVGELTEAVGADISTVSKHLAVLKKAGLVRDKKHGTFCEYELSCGCITHFIECIEQSRQDAEHAACNTTNASKKQGKNQ